MKILKTTLLLLCPLLLNACFNNKEIRLDGIEENLLSVEEKVEALLTHTDKTFNVVADMNLRLEALEQDAKKRGVPIRIKGADIAAARAELLRTQGKEPATRIGLNSVPNATIQNTLMPPPQYLLPKQNMSKQQASVSKNEPLSSSKKARKPTKTKSNIKAQDLQFPEHAVVSPPVTPGSITGQNLSKQNKQVQLIKASAVPKTAPILLPTLPPMIPVVQQVSVTDMPVTQMTPVVSVTPLAQSGPPQSYNTAMALYKSQKYKEAEQAFDSFLRANPDAVLAPNALYWKGETFYARGNYPQAIFAFKEVQTRYPKHSKAADSLLKTAMSYGKIGDTENADLHYLVLEEDFPTSTAAKRVPK